MQRSSSGSRRTTGANSHRPELNRIVENRIFISNSSAQPNLSQKLDDIKKQISRQYQKTFSTERKQSVVLRENEPSVLNSRKVREVLAREEEQRYREQYFELKDQYLNEKKEFVQAIERYNSLRTVIESYFRNPLEPSYIGKLKEYYLSDNIDEYIEFVLELNRENEELKGHIERMLKIFQLHDFEDMIREITEMLDRDRQQKTRDYECELDRIRLDLLESQKQARDYTKVVEEQHDQMKELSVELQAKRVLLKEAEKRLADEHRERVECQAALQRTTSERDTSMGHIEQLKSEFQAFTNRIQELTAANDKLKASSRRLEGIVESQELESVEFNRKIVAQEEQRNRLMQSVVEEEQRFLSVDNRLNKMIEDYQSSRVEWADQVRAKDMELSALRQQLTYEKISINRVCDLLRVVEQDEISERIKSLLSTEVQYSASQPLLADFHKKMEQMLNDNLQLKEELAKVGSQRSEYKFVLGNLNQDIVRLRKEEQERWKAAMEKQEQSFKQQDRQLRKQLDLLQGEKKSAEEQLAFHKKQNDVLLMRNDKLIKDLSAGEEASRALAADNKKLKDDLSNIYVELKEIEELNTLTSSKLKLSQEEVGVFKEKLERTETQMGRLVKQYQQQLQRKDTDIGVWKEKCELALSNLETLKAEMAFRENDNKITIGKLTSELESKCSLLSLSEESHRRRLGESDKRYQQLSNEQALLRDELANLQRQLLLRNEQSMELGRKLKQEKTTAQKELERYKQKCEELEFEVSRRQQQLEELNSELKKLRRDKNEMSAKLLKCRSQEKIQFDQLEEEKERLQHELEMATARIEDFQNGREMDAEAHKLQMQAESEKRRAAEETLRKNEKILAETQQTLSNWNAEHDETVIELAQAQTYLAQMQGALSQKEDQIKRLSNRIVQLEQAPSTKQDQSAPSRRTTVEASGWGKYFASDSPAKEPTGDGHASKQSGMSPSQVHQLRLSVEANDQTIGHLQEEVKELQSYIDKLKAEIQSRDGAQRQILELQQKLTELQQANRQLNASVQAKHREMVVTQEQLQNEKECSARNESELEELRQRFEKANLLISELSAKPKQSPTAKDAVSQSELSPSKDSDLVKKCQALQAKNQQMQNKLSILESVYKQQTDHSKRQHDHHIKKLEEDLSEVQQDNQVLRGELAQTSNLLVDLNRTLDELKQNESRRVKWVLVGLLNPQSDRESRESLPYWPDISDLFDEILAKMTKLKQNALEISVVEGPRTNRGLPSPSPSLGKEFVFERQKTDPVMQQPQNERIAELTHQLEQLRAENNMLKAQASDVERNEETFMMLQNELKQEIKDLQRKNRELQSNTNTQTVRTLKALFSKLLEAMFANNPVDLEEATRVILKILDYSPQEREEIQDNFDKRKKKKGGFLGLFK